MTITGTNFTGTTAVNFGPTASPSFTVNSAASITAVSPAGSGIVDVTVTTPSGTSAISGADKFTYGGVGRAVHDFNGDGFSDILWRDNIGDLAVWLMSGAQVLQSSGLGNVSFATWSIVGQRDFNGDGYSDILWRDVAGNTSIWFMQRVAGFGGSGIWRRADVLDRRRNSRLQRRRER